MGKLEKEFEKEAKKFKIDFTTRHMTVLFLAQLESLPKNKIKETLLDIIPDRNLIRPLKSLFEYDKKGCMILLRDITKRYLEYLYQYQKSDFNHLYLDAEECMKEFENKTLE